MPPPKIESIAMLRLDDLCGDAGQEYFVDGMTDALIAELGKISALGLARSRRCDKGTDEPVAEAVRELGVDGMGEGSVRRQSRPNQGATGQRGA